MSKIAKLKKYIKNEVLKILTEDSKLLFEKHPELTSFGWHQFITEQSRDRFIIFEDSLERPDISGALGEYIYASNSDTYELQSKVADHLREYGTALLETAFGDGIDIAVYKDGSIEITGDSELDNYFEPVILKKHDINRSMVNELSES